MKRLILAVNHGKRDAFPHRSIGLSFSGSCIHWWRIGDRHRGQNLSRLVRLDIMLWRDGRSRSHSACPQRQTVTMVGSSLTGRLTMRKNPTPNSRTGTGASRS
jgi:hypothetical protein